MLGRTDSRARLILLLCFLGLFAGALTLRLAYWQIGQGDELRTLADQQLANPAEADETRRDSRQQWIRSGHHGLSGPPGRLS
jgi:hypothetical protein